MEMQHSSKASGLGGTIVVVVVVVVLIALNSGQHISLPTTQPGQPGQGSTTNVNASANVTRISQDDPGQYASTLDFNTWSPSACSAASMTVVINAYGHTYHLADILKVEHAAGQITPDQGLLYGVDSIRATVKSFGFTAKDMSGASLDTVIATANAGQPVIVSFPPATWQGGHILVVRAGDANTVTLADSSHFNLTTISRAKFLHYWRAWAVLVAPDQTASTSTQPVAPGDLSIVGQPSLTGDQITAVLRGVGSPAASDGQYLYDQGVKVGIDPAIALAFFMYESTGGTKGEAVTTLAIGNERCINDRPCVDRQRGGYAQFYNWQDGIDHWYSMMLHGYVQGAINKAIGRHACPCTTVAAIIPVYAPTSDRNNEQEYIDTVVRFIVQWRKIKA